MLHTDAVEALTPTAGIPALKDWEEVSQLLEVEKYGTMF